MTNSPTNIGAMKAAKADEYARLRDPSKGDLMQENKHLRERVRELEDHIDLMVDEFQRIKSVAFNNGKGYMEIASLCKRAIAVTKQNVSVIDQRDRAEKYAEQCAAEAIVLAQRNLKAINKIDDHSKTITAEDKLGCNCNCKAIVMLNELKTILTQ